LHQGWREEEIGRGKKFFTSIGARFLFPKARHPARLKARSVSSLKDLHAKKKNSKQVNRMLPLRGLKSN
jgi:hypothetical protein